MKVGVLGLQGDVREHAAALSSVGAAPVIVKDRSALESVEALVLPGGESTTIAKLLELGDLLEPLRARVAGGMALYGTCAGLILMAARVDDAGATHGLGVLDATVRRNAYGRQVDSFEADLAIDGDPDPFPAVFIRAPVIESVGDGVDVLARWDDRPVLVRQGRLLASSFHPEITGDARVHELFMGMVA